MEVNLTLFVQMGNFAVAYFLLRTLLFRPAIDVLHAQEHALRIQKDALAKQDQELTAQRRAVADAWQECRDYFKEHRPEDAGVRFAPFCGITPRFKPEHIDESVKKQHQQVLEQTIIKKVSHVRV